MFLAYALPIILLPNTLHLPADVGMGASILLLAAAAVFGQRDPPAFSRTSLLAAPLAGLFAALLLGWALAQWRDPISPLADLVRAKYAITFPLLYLAYRHCGLDPAATRKLILLTMLVAVMAGLEAVLQGLQFDLGTFSDDQRATGPFGEQGAANRAGVFFAMFLPLPVALALQPGCRPHVRLLALAGSGILLAAIMFTFSRQSYLIAVAGILLVLLNRGLTVTLLALLAIAIAAVILVPESAMQRIEGTREVGAGVGNVTVDDSTASRLEIWAGAMAMLADHPFGAGLDRFVDLIGEYSPHAGKDAHNGFVLMLAECGPFGLAMMLWLFWRVWVLTRRLRATVSGTTPEARALALGMTVSVACMAAGNVYGSPFFSGLVMHSFWVLCGLMERYGLMLAHAAEVRGGRAPVRGRDRLVARFPLAARAVPGLQVQARGLRQ